MIAAALAAAIVAVAVWAGVRARLRWRSIRAEFLRPWPAVVVFTSTDCDACNPVRETVLSASPAKAVREVAYQRDAGKFRSSGIDKVPAVVVIDAHGKPVGFFEGAVSSREIGRALRRARLR